MNPAIHQSNEEFYIGWQAQAPKGIGSRVRKTVIVLLLLAPLLSVLLVFAQRTIGRAVFQWGHIKAFSGVLQSRPYPHLLVSRPAQSNGAPSASAYYLVAPLKFGLNSDSLVKFDGKPVLLKGTLIYRGNQTMIEARPDSIQLAPESSTASAVQTSGKQEKLGRQTLIGEIVDSKCYLGVMNPGQFTPHRACAVRCISGGIPPILVVRSKEGLPLYFLLVSSDGHPLNKQILDMVAEPVEITGEVERQGELLVLRADPQTYRRVKL